MNRKPTEELNTILENMKPEQLDEYFRDNRSDLAEGKAFYYFMKDTCANKEIRLKDVYSFAGESETYGSKILSMEKHTTNRDLIIRLCVAGHFNLREINRALKLYGMTELYAKDPRDACIIVAINNRTFDLAEIDDILTGHGFARLSKEI